MKFRAIATALLIVSAPFASANNAAAEQERYQRQYRYANLLMRLNGLGGELSPSELAKMEVSTQNVLAPIGPERGSHDATMDAFAEAVETSLVARRAKRGLSRQWQINEAHPIHYSVSANPATAGDCSRAIEHVLGQPLRIDMNRDGVAWLRVVAPKAGYWAFDTLVSEFDTRLSVYRDCRDIKSDSKQVSDDVSGLGSIVGLEAKVAGQTFLIKLERKGGFGSLAFAKSVHGAFSITGHVTRASGGGIVPYPQATAFGEQLSPHSSSGSDGSYSIVVYEPGEYRIRSGGVTDLVQKAWPDAPCSNPHPNDIDSCQGVITPIEVVPGTSTYTADFSLSVGAVVTGIITDRETGAPVPQVLVSLFEAGRPPATQGQGFVGTDEFGRFRIGGLPTRDWYVEYEHPMYQRQRWRDTPCAGTCAYQSGDLLSTVQGSGPVRADAALMAAPHLRIRGAAGIEPIFSPSVLFFDASGTYLPELQFNPQQTATPGEYVFGPLPAGQYRLVVYPANQTFGKVVGGADCVFYPDCSDAILGGEIVQVPVSGGVVRSVEFRPYVSLSGSVTEPSGTPIQAGTVASVTDDGYVQLSVPIENGTYQIDRVPPYGEILLLAKSSQHVDVLFGDVPCEVPATQLDCPPGTRLSFGLDSAQQRTADFVLSRSARIEGRMASPAWPGIDTLALLHRLRADGSIAASYAVQSQDEAYALSDVVLGTHYWAYDNVNHARQVYPGVICPGAFDSSFETCPLGPAEPITLTTGETRLAVDFEYFPHYTRLVRVVSAQTGLPLTGVALDQWANDGTYVRSHTTNAAGWGALMVGYFPGSYAILTSTYNNQGYLDKVLPDIECAAGTAAYLGNCSLNGGVPIPIYDAQHAAYPPLVIALNFQNMFSNSFE